MENSDQTSQPQNLPGAFELLKPSWQAVKLNIITFIELIIVPIMFSLVFGLVGGLSKGFSMNTWGIFWEFLSIIASLVFAPALIITQLKSVRGEEIDFLPALRQGLSFFWRYIGLAICMAIIIGIGFILLIIPGFFMIRRYILAPYFLIDQNLSISEALKVSAERSKQFSSALWGMIGVIFLFGILCYILVGIVLSIMYYCAPAVRYLEIKGKSDGKASNSKLPVED